jgi:hypothetical protein
MSYRYIDYTEYLLHKVHATKGINYRPGQRNLLEDDVDVMKHKTCEGRKKKDQQRSEQGKSSREEQN